MHNVESVAAARRRDCWQRRRSFPPLALSRPLFFCLPHLSGPELAGFEAVLFFSGQLSSVAERAACGRLQLERLPENSFSTSTPPHP